MSTKVAPSFLGSVPVLRLARHSFHSAVTRSGMTGPRARMIASALLGQRWLPKVVAAGYAAFRMLPLGMVSVIGRTMPSLWGRFGLTICRSVRIAADALEVKVPL